MNTHAARLALAVAVLLLSASCASVSDRDHAVSEAEMKALLVGRWYQIDTAGQFQLPHRFEISFAPDGRCTFSFIPKDPAQPRGITDGTWQLSGRSIVFHWTPRSNLASQRPVADGPIHHLDRHRLELMDPIYKSISVFYRSYQESLIKLPPTSSQATRPTAGRFVP